MVGQFGLDALRVSGGRVEIEGVDFVGGGGGPRWQMELLSARGLCEESSGPAYDAQKYCGPTWDAEEVHAGTWRISSKAFARWKTLRAKSLRRSRAVANGNGPGAYGTGLTNAR
jgi:hypothetical protein